MPMTQNQIERFYTLLRQLMMYANARLDLVVNFNLERSDALDDPLLVDKCLVILQEIWQDEGIIDDFIRDRGYALTNAGLQAVSQWKHALFGVYDVVAIRDNKAIMASGAGLFAVQCVAGDVHEVFSRLPTCIEGALLPYEGAIVMQEPFRDIGTPPYDLDLQALDDAFFAAHTPIASAVDFALLAQASKQRFARDELTYLLNDAEREDEAPEGFHRGALYGIEGDEREQLIRGEEERLGFVPERLLNKYVTRWLLKHPVASQLTAALGQLNKERLKQVARALGLTGYTALKKDELVATVVCELEGPNQDAHLTALVQASADRELQLIDRVLAAGGTCDLAQDDIMLAPREPLSFAYRTDRGFHAFVPDELRMSVLAEAVHDELQLRARDDVAALVLETCTFYYGVIELDEAYGIYEAYADDPISRDRFELLASGALEDTCTTGVWSLRGVDYVVHAVLSDQRVAEDAQAVARETVVSKSLQQMRDAGVSEDAYAQLVEKLAADGALMKDAVVQTQSFCKQFMEEGDRYIESLIDEHRAIKRKPLNRVALASDPLDLACDSPEARALQAFLDGVVPDGENDFFFAERVVEEVVFAVIESGSLSGASRVLRGYGYTGEDPATVKLVRLVNNLYSVLPSWENNGWSPREQTERITGRKIFYAPDGSVLKPGRNDPCPCGSGKKYKKCCGR